MRTIEDVKRLVLENREMNQMIISTKQVIIDTLRRIIELKDIRIKMLEDLVHSYDKEIKL